MPLFKRATSKRPLVASLGAFFGTPDPGRATNEAARVSAVLQRRSFLAGMATVLLLTFSAIAPLPYVIEHPGPTVDVLGDYRGQKLITVPDEQQVGGPLRMTTVSVSGLPGDSILAMPLTFGVFNSKLGVMPRELLFPEGQTAEENREISAAQMNSSQENASIAALESMGRKVPVNLEVAGFTEGSSAAEQAKVGDIVKTVAAPGHEVLDASSYRDVIGLMSTIAPGTNVKVTVERDGKPVDLAITTMDPPVNPDGTPQREGSLLGLALYAHPKEKLDIDFGVGDRIGGPSAGLMFALGIIDMMTPGPLTGDASVAGTGTISLDGAVGPIGGIRQKMWGAKRDGASYFLIPEANCAETIGHVPDGLQGIKVQRLDDALAAVKSIAAGDTSKLATCEAPS